MKKNIFKKNSAFTLIELMVAITLIAIIVIGGMNLNFNRLSGRQKLDIFSNKIISNIETVRNNALLGKGIGVNLYVPTKWKIEISNTNSGTQLVNYLSGTNWYNFPENSLAINKPYFINNIECVKLDSSTGSLSSQTGTIIITKGNLSLTGCTDNSYKILKFNTNLAGDSYSIEVNTLNGIIKKY